MPNYYEEQVKKDGRKKRIDRTEARIISTTKSYQSRSSWNRGLPHSEATKEKISQTLTQKYKEGIHKPWNKGMKIKQKRQSHKVDPLLTSYPIQEQQLEQQ